MYHIRTLSKLIFFISVPIIFGCAQEHRSECNYKSFNRIVYVGEIVKDAEGSVLGVTFETGGVSNNQKIVLNLSDLDKAEKNFEFEILKDKTKYFLLEGEKLTEGSCVPFILNKITLI